MSLHNRYLQPFVEKDLQRKMVFVGGPRQVGKTTFALNFLPGGSERHPAYFNWDDIHHRVRIRRGEVPANEPLLIFDEIHKYARWRNLIKGLYDTQKSRFQFLVTGSARLDHYRKGGDSLQGRYHYYRLHPFSLREVHCNPVASDVLFLLRFGGFPEPFFSGTEQECRRWQIQRRARVLYEDLRDLERVQEVSLIELLLDALPARVGSPLSIRSLREELEVAHQTAERWITILENLYVCFRIPPFGTPKIRAVKKEQKLYFWDWSEVEMPGPRFENLVASQLRKFCHLVQDTQGYRMELRYIRDIDKREVDFLVLQDRKPLFAVECKTGEKSVSSALKYIAQRIAIPRLFQVHLGTKDYLDAQTGIRVLPFHKMCSELLLP